MINYENKTENKQILKLRELRNNLSFIIEVNKNKIEELKNDFKTINSLLDKLEEKDLEDKLVNSLIEKYSN